MSEYLTKDGRPIEFEVTPYNEVDERGFTVHKIEAKVDGQYAGYIKLSYIPKDKWREAFPTIWHFRQKMLGKLDVPEKLFGDWAAMVEDYGKRYTWSSAEHVLKRELEKAQNQYKKYKAYFVDKPIVDFISTDKGSFQHQGIASALHLFAAKWLKEKFGLPLYFSGLMTPAGQGFYDKFKPKVKIEKVKIPPRLRLDDRKEREVMVAHSILRIARDILSEDGPQGLSPRGQEAFDILKKAVSSKQIYNVDYEAAKSILTYNFEKAAVASTMLLGAFLYALEGTNLSLRTIPSYTKTIRSALAKRDTEKVLKTFPAATGRGQALVEQWDDYADQAEKHLQKLETWLSVANALGEAKPYVVKGRKPSTTTQTKYVPPLAGTAAIALVKEYLQEIVSGQRTALIDRLVKRYTEVASHYDGNAESKNVMTYLKKFNAENLYNVAFETVNFNDLRLREDFTDRIKHAVEKQVDELILLYLSKNTSKLASLIEAKGKPVKVEVRGDLEGWGFSGRIRFEFADGTGFTVDNKCVWKQSQGGKWTSGKLFYQFPTTFHQVKFKDGTVRAMVSEEEMNTVWAKA